ncbi:MAG: recombination regulator RecX, partial [Limosilactobacillus fermentum]
TQGYGDEVYQLVKENEIPSQTEDRQAELLEREVEKAWHRYRRFEGYERKMKTKQALYRKGFDLDEIDHWLAKQENLNNL